MEKELIGITAKNEKLYVISNDEHMIAHKDVLEEHVKQAISKIEDMGIFGFYTIDLGKTIGTTKCVETSEKDDIRMECRPGRDLPSRMVYGRTPEETTLITIGICKDDDGLMTIFTAFYGELAPKELSDPRLTDEERPAAEEFWKKHALIAE